jgi:hypothetical protein
MKSIFKISSLVFATSVLVTSCAKNDAFDSNYKSEQYQTSFESIFGTIDSNQDWNLTSSRTAKITLAGSSSENYIIDICSTNPATDPNSKSLYKTTAKGGQTLTATFDAPTALSRVFVSRAGSDGQYYIAADLSDNIFNTTFENAIVASAKTRSSAVVSGDPFTFETVTYPTSVPSDIINGDNLNSSSTNDDQNLTNIELPTSNKTYSFHFWSNSRNIYVSGKNITLNVDNSYSINSATIYVLPGASLAFNCANNINACTYYICPGATMNYNYGSLAAANNTIARIYNKGTLNLTQNFSFGNYAYVYNEGTINAAEQNISFDSGSGCTSFLYNTGGSITAKSITMNSTCNMYNSGAIAVSGKTSCTQAGCWWINNGHYTTGSMEVGAYNKTFYSNCQLIVNDLLYIHEGEFNVLNGGYVQCNTFQQNNNFVNLGSKAAFYVKNGSTFNANADGTFQGFKGTTLDYCLVKLGETTTVAEHKNTLQISGNIYYTTEKALSDVASNNGNYPTILYGTGTKGVTYNKAILGIPLESTCCPEWKIDNESSTIPAAAYTIAFEDLGSIGDFDFNDVVLYVYPDQSAGTMKIDLVAAGGTLVSDIYFNGEKLFSTTGSMTNTYNNNIDYTKIINTVTKALPSGYSFSNSDYTSLFKIIVDGSESVEAGYNKGKAPQVLVIPDAWKWPYEQQSVDKAYPNFSTWVADKSKGTIWYK